MLKTFPVAPEQDSVRTAFSSALCAAGARLTLERRLAAFPEYLLKQAGLPVAIIRGKEMVVGGEHFAVIPLLPLNWAETGLYAHHPDNVPYWGGEQRLKSLDLLLYSLSQGWTIPAALDDAVVLQDEWDARDMLDQEQPEEQPEDYPLPKLIEWEPEPEPTPPAGMTSDEYLASKQPQHPHLTRIYPWAFWYRGGDGEPHQMLLEASYEDAQRAWDALSPVFEMTSRRP